MGVPLSPTGGSFPVIETCVCVCVRESECVCVCMCLRRISTFICSLSHQPVRAAGAIELSKMLVRNSSLTELRIENGKLNAKALIPLAHVLNRNMCKLRLLNIKGHRVTIEHASILGRVIGGSTSLEVLQFGPYHSIPVQEVRGHRHSSPYTLNLSSFGYGPTDVSLIAGMFFDNTLLSGLDLSSNPLTAAPETMAMPAMPIPPYDLLTGYDEPRMNDGPGAVHAEINVRIIPPPVTLVNGLAKNSRQEGILMLARNIAHMPKTSLTFLDLHNSGVDCVGAYHLAVNLIRNVTLRTLTLDEVPLPIQEVPRPLFFCQLLVQPLAPVCPWAWMCGDAHVSLVSFILHPSHTHTRSAATFPLKSWTSGATLSVNR